MDRPGVAEHGRPATQAQRPARGLFHVDHSVRDHELFRPLSLDCGTVREHHQNRRRDVQAPFHGCMPGKDGPGPARTDRERRRRAPLRIQEPLAVGLIADALPIARHFRKTERPTRVRACDRFHEMHGNVPDQAAALELQPWRVEDQCLECGRVPVRPERPDQAAQ
ncbi:hypothetical protein D9M72_556830 [compost metagenome]